MLAPSTPPRFSSRQARNLFLNPDTTPASAPHPPQGPSDTCYENGTFKLDIRVPEHYPLVPPAVRFRTKIFHPNIHFKTGEVCLDILKTAWSPAWTLQSVCQAVLALLSAPEPSSPLNCDAGNLLRAGDVRGFNSLARMYTIEHAAATL